MKIISLLKENILVESLIQFNQRLREGPAFIFFVSLIVNLVLLNYNILDETLFYHVIYSIALIIIYMFSFTIVMIYVYDKISYFESILLKKREDQLKIQSIIKDLKPKQFSNTYYGIEKIERIVEQSVKEGELDNEFRKYNDIRYALVSVSLLTIFLIDFISLLYFDKSILMLLMSLLIDEVFRQGELR